MKTALNLHAYIQRMTILNIISYLYSLDYSYKYVTILPVPRQCKVRSYA